MAAFDGHLKPHGYLAMGGQIIDATIVPVPINRNTQEEKAVIKAGGVPEDWQTQPAKLRQKDLDARWTKEAWAVVLRLQEPHHRGPAIPDGAP